MDFLEDLRMSLLNYSFVMFYIIHKMLVLLKKTLNYLKENFFERIFRKFFSYIMMKNLGPAEENIIKDKRNLFTLIKN